MSYICVNDLAEIAKEKLPSDIFNFIAGGAMNEITLNRNEAAFKEQLILPRCLNPVGQLNTSIQLFDKCLSAPIFASPIAFQSLAHPEGEIATMRAIDALQLGMISSTMSSKSLEQIASEAHFAALYFQLYIYKNRTFTERLIKRAERANYQAIVITIDVPIMGRRYRDIRAKFNLPTHCIAENLPEELVEELHSQHNSDASTVMQFTNQHFANDLSWGDISWVKSLTDLPVILKGIMHPLDAREAISHGIDGIIVSNHGGRQLDSVPATIEVLSSISQIVNQKIPILDRKSVV